MLVAGLELSVVLMAATLIARLLERERWIAWLCLLILLFVAGKPIWQGGQEVQSAGGA